MDLVVLLGSNWAALESHNTRWRSIVVEWAARSDVDSISVVDFPHFGRRALLHARSPIQSAPSWHPRVARFAAHIPLSARPGPIDAAVWRRTARCLRRTVLQTRDCVVVATTPLWASLLPWLGDVRTAFDGVDDWRSYPATAHLLDRVEAGYRDAASASVVTCVSSELARRLAEDFGLQATVVPNGADLGLFATPGELPASLAARLPTAAFAVYAGWTDESKIDFTLLDAVADVMPVVVAGPSTPAGAIRLDRPGITALGPVPYEDLPALLHAASVGIAPLLVNDLTRSMNPMKVLEYLAAGLRVVASPVDALQGLSPRVRIAIGDDFALAALAAVRQRRFSRADSSLAGRGWDAISDRLLDVVTATSV